MKAYSQLKYLLNYAGICSMAPLQTRLSSQGVLVDETCYRAEAVVTFQVGVAMDSYSFVDSCKVAFLHCTW